MTTFVGLTAVLTACIGAGSPGELVLEGPAEVKVDQLGKVEGPMFVVDGVPDAEIGLSADPEHVAHWRAGELHAIGPGEAMVRGTWNEQTVEWKLTVEPQLSVMIANPPATLLVGESKKLSLQVNGGTVDDLPQVSWVSSDDATATIDSAGEVQAIKPGMVYVSVKAGSAEAMAEIQVKADE